MRKTLAQALCAALLLSAPAYARQQAAPLQQMPIELMRASMLNLPLSPDYKALWKFYGDITPGEKR